MVFLPKPTFAAALLLTASTCFAQPANDECSGAISLPVNPNESCAVLTNGTTLNATPSAQVPSVCCGSPDDDVWYSFVASNVNHVVQVSQVVSANTNAPNYATVAVFSGGCGNYNLLASNYFDDNGAIWLSNLSVGASYYVRIYSYFDQTPIDFDLCVTVPLPPANDNCADAVPVSPNPDLYCSTTFGGNTSGATMSRTDCSGDPNDDIWYQFVATSPSHYVTISGASGLGSFGIEILGGDCNTLTSLGCTESPIYYAELEVQNLNIGSTYYIRIFSQPNAPQVFNGCLTTLPPPPANDECSGALPLTVNPDFNCTQTITGSTVGATGSQPGCGGGSTHDVWYSFAATSAIHRLDFQNVNTVLGSGNSTFGYEVYAAGDCGSLTSIHCEPTAFPAVLANLTPGATYFVRLYSSQSSGHNFTFCLQTLPPAPNNLDCASAQPLTPSNGPTCAAVTQGSSASLTSTSVQPCIGEGSSVWYSFTATSRSHILRISNIQLLYGYYTGYSASVYTGDCNNLTHLRCIYSPEYTVLSDLTIGQTYYVAWTNGQYAAFSFDICIGTYPPVANDICADAAVLNVDPDLVCDTPTAGTLAGAATESGYGCVGGPDVWYKFTATQAAHVLSVQNVVFVEYGTPQPFSLQLFEGTCDNLTEIRCWSGNAYGGTLKVGDLQAGQTYFMRIGIYYDAPIQFDICVLTPPPPPANDACAQSALVSVDPDEICDATHSGTTQHATLSNGYCCDGQVDVWYSFTALQANQTLLFSNVLDIANPPNSTFCRVEVYPDICGYPNPEGILDLYNAGVLTLTNLTPGATYHIRFSSFEYANPSGVTFEFCITSPPPPVNDECINALPLPLNPDLNCNAVLIAYTAGATQSLPGCTTEPVNDIWYQFEAAATAYRFNLSLYSSAGNDSPWGYEFFAGDCNNLVSLHCSQLGYEESFILNNLVAGNTYYLRLYSTRNRISSLSVCARQLPPPPANDECANAQTLSINPDVFCNVLNYGTTLAATQSMPTCSGENNGDVWYTFVASSPNYRFEFTLTNSYFGDYYSAGLEILTGDCNNLSLVNCLSNFYSGAYILQNLTPGQTYYIRIYSKGTEAHDFTLCMQTMPPSPPNDACADAQTLVPNEGLNCDLTYPGTTLSATFEPNAYNPDVWYSFTATSGGHIFSFANVVSVFGGPVGLSYELLKGDDCGNLVQLGVYDAFSDNVFYTLEIGAQYFLRVLSNYPDQAYQFELCIKSLPPSPANESCEGAIEITPNSGLECTSAVSGTTLGALYQSYFNCYYGNDVWYKFTATSPVHRVQLQNIAGVLGDGSIAFEVMQGPDCNSLGNLNCTYNGELATLTNLTPGEVYYIRVISATNSAHTYDLCVTTMTPPANDQCPNALLLEVSPDQSCSNFTNATTLGASYSGLISCSYDGNDVWFRFVATQATHSIALANITDALYPYNTASFGIEMYSGACENLQLLYCRHNLFYTDSYTYGDLIPGQTYYVRVLSYGDQFANFNICVGTPPPPPANDACPNAIAIIPSEGPECNTLTSGTLAYSTPSPQPFNNSYYFSNDVWYSFTATQANHAVSFSNVINPNNWSTNLVLEIYTGTCGALSLQIQLFLASSEPQLLTNLTPGTVYYLRVMDYYNQPLSFDICVTGIPSPANDACGQAVNIPVNPGLTCTLSTTGTTYGATQSQAGCYGTAANDVWYKFTASNANQLLDIQQTGGTGPNYNLVGIEIFTGDCNGLSTFYPCVQYSGPAQLTITGLTPGTVYYLRLYSLPNSYQNFNICLRTLPPPPANDACAQAKNIKPKKGTSCQKPEAGTTAGLTDYNSQGCFSGPDVWYWFEAKGPNYLIQLSDLVLLYGYSFLGLELYHGNSCATLELITCTQGSSGIYLNNLVDGDNYYIRIIGGTQSGVNFNLCVLEIDEPSNDDCADAKSIQPSTNMTCKMSKTGTTLGASASEAPGNCNFGIDVWYSFVATQTTHVIEFSNNQFPAGYSNFMYEVFSGTCGTLNSLGCFPAFYPGTLENLVPGNKYYIRVISDANAPVSFNLCILTPRPDLSVAYIITPSNGCGAGPQEPVDIYVYNNGNAIVPANGAKVTLTITGVNAGLYGPIYNLYPVYPGAYQVLTIPNVNLSAIGASTFKAKVTATGDSNPNNNTLTVPFQTLQPTTWYYDGDGDGYGNPGSPYTTCFPIQGYVTNDDDCNDENAAIHPGAEDTCDGLDNDCNGIVDDCMSISGTIRWEHNSSAVKQVQVTLSGDDSGIQTTAANGAYEFTQIGGSNFAITPAKNINLLNGVTMADANLVRRKALGQNVLNSPYKLIAADVDKNNAITMNDYNLLVQTINANGNNPNAFSPSWRFVPAAYTFPNPQNPWGFPENLTLSGVTGHLMGQDFTGIKLGDVNGSANPAQKPAGQPATPLVWRVDDQVMTPGSSVKVAFEAASFKDLAAFQFALRFDPETLRLDSPEGLPVLALSADNFGVSEVEQGIIRMTWDAIDAQTLVAGTPVFQLNFTVLRGNTRLSEALHLDEKVMPAEAFNQDLQAAGIDLVFTESLGQHPDIAQQGPVLLENRPNPFTDRTIIRFMLPKSETATVSVFDALGRKLWQQTQQYDEGYHEVPVQLGHLPAAGFLYYELATPSGKWSRKMVRAVP